MTAAQSRRIPTDQRAVRAARDSRRSLTARDRAWLVAAFALLVAAPAGCRNAPVPAPVAVEPGDPLPDLTAAERARFVAGRALFDRIFTPAQGLGPLFNENQCSACHTQPASGGTGEQFAHRATRFEPPDRCDLLPAEGGENVQSNATPLLRAVGIERRPVPQSATEQGRFFAPFLFGLGLLEAVPDEAILTRSDPDDRDGDGVSGRPGRDRAGRLARFGRKAEHVTIAGFVAGALLLEMGLTSPANPTEPLLNGAPMPADVDPAADPEVDAETVGLLTDFVRFLAPLPPRQPAARAERGQLERGERLFAEAGCTACHTPALETGPADARALDHKRVNLYSDLLLHDMGPELAGACGIGASPAEYRTEPLMGIRFRRQFLHDARALSIMDAIMLHGGEATRSRDAFAALDRVTQELIIRFVQTL